MNYGGEEVNLLYLEVPNVLPSQELRSELFPEIHPPLPGHLTPSIAHEDVLPSGTLGSGSYAKD